MKTLLFYNIWECWWRLGSLDFLINSVFAHVRWLLSYNHISFLFFPLENRHVEEITEL